MAEGNGKTAVNMAALHQGVTAEFNVPLFWREIGGQRLYIRAITSTEGDDLELNRLKDYRLGPDGRPIFKKSDLNMENFRARHAVVFLGDQHNNRIYTDNDIKHVGQMWPRKLLDEVYELGRKHNVVPKSAGEEEGEAEKNSSAAASGPGST